MASLARIKQLEEKNRHFFGLSEREAAELCDLKEIERYLTSKVCADVWCVEKADQEVAIERGILKQEVVVRLDDLLRKRFETGSLSPAEEDELLKLENICVDAFLVVRAGYAHAYSGGILSAVRSAFAFLSCGVWTTDHSDAEAAEDKHD